MSDITIPCSEVVNGHTDVICSTSVSHILAVRKSTLLQIDTLIRQLAEISAMTESIGGKTALDWAMKQDFRCSCWLMEKPETAMKAITRNLDREIWRDLMQRSGMLSLMDAQAHDTWYRSLEYDNFLEISKANILSTFEQLHQNKDEMFERGVINVFRGLSWNYKTRSPCKFDSKIIVNNLVRWDRWGFFLNHGPQADQLADLERMLLQFIGNPIPGNGENITIHQDGTSSLFRVKSAMKMRCSASDTLRRAPRTSRSGNQNWLTGLMILLRNIMREKSPFRINLHITALSLVLNKTGRYTVFTESLQIIIQQSSIYLHVQQLFFGATMGAIFFR